jgi:predicted nucleic-acid-binding protein
MAALDTSVLIRFLVRDDEAQLEIARKLIAGCVAAGESLFVPVTVALELEWVLRVHFGFSKAEVIQTFAALLSAVELTFESEAALELALASYRDAAADFSDCLNIALAHLAGESPLWTFDKAAARIDGAELLSA